MGELNLKMVIGNPTVRDIQYLQRAKKLDKEARELWWQFRLDDVEECYKEAINYRESVLGPNHPKVGRSLIRLARLYWGMD